MDYKRMEWQVRANKIAVGAMIVCVLLGADEVVWALRYHFPWWGDVAGILTVIVWLTAYFVKEHTEMYRIDR